MKKILNITPLSIEELNQWKNNPLINPKTKKKIKENSRTYNLLKKSYDSYISNISNESIILKCNEDRDLISLNLFWTEKDKIKKIVYPKDQLDQLIFYTDNNNKVRGFEKESLKYMKTYNITNHPISNEPIHKEHFPPTFHCVFTSQPRSTTKHLHHCLENHKGRHLRSRVKIDDEGECIYGKHQRIIIKYSHYTSFFYYLVFIK